MKLNMVIIILLKIIKLQNSIMKQIKFWMQLLIKSVILRNKRVYNGDIILLVEGAKQPWV